MDSAICKIIKARSSDEDIDDIYDKIMNKLVHLLEDATKVKNQIKIIIFIEWPLW